MDLILFLVFGLVVGVIARLIVPGRQPGGWLASIAFGVLGSFAGGLIGRLFGLYGAEQRAGFVMSVAGAVLLLVGYHAVVGRRTT